MPSGIDPTVSSHLGVYLLNQSHADQLQRLFLGWSANDVAMNPPPFAAGQAQLYVARQLQLRTDGTSYASAIMDRASLVGLCALEDTDGRQVENLGCK